MPATSLQGTLVASALFALFAASAYAAVGVLVLRRLPRESAPRFAAQAFATWWFAVAALAVLDAARSVLAVGGVVDAPAHSALTFITLLPLVAGLGGLVYYLVYVYTRREDLMPLVVGFHLVVLVLFAYVVWWMRPTGVDLSPWTVELATARGLDPGANALVLGVLLGPTLAAAGAYGSLFFLSKSRAVKYRVGLVSTAFLMWFGTAALGAGTGLADAVWWPVASRVTGLAAAALVLAAYEPPRVVRHALAAPARDPDPQATAPPADAQDDARRRWDLRVVKGAGRA